jgi:hypothetical protein
MDYPETCATAETELRESILLEFIKPDLPAPITLLLHCERYITKIFDARAARKIERSHARKIPLRFDEYEKFLQNMVTSLPGAFLGCPAPASPTMTGGTKDRRKQWCRRLGMLVLNPHPDSRWGECIKYVLLARVGRSDLPRTDDMLLKLYSVTNGHHFLSFALQRRAIFWNLKFRGHTLEDNQINDYREALHARKVDATAQSVPIAVAVKKPRPDRKFVDDRHEFCVDQFDKIRHTTTVDKWLETRKSISRTQLTDYLAGRIKRRVSPEKRQEIEAAILNSDQ